MVVENLATHNQTTTPLRSHQQTSNSKKKTSTFFGIRIGQVGLLVPAELYCEILHKTPVYKLPNVNPWLSGMVNLRGNLAPIFDLSLLLENQLNSSKRLFSIDRNENAVVLWIDNLPEILELSQLQPNHSSLELPTILKNCVTGTFQYKNQAWLTLDFDSLFTELGRKQPSVKGTLS